MRALAERPVIGCGCCAVAAAVAIERTLGEWRGVRAVEVDEKNGRVTVTLADRERPSNADLVWSLRMLGLDAVAEEVGHVSPF